jgi:hypothetical protein
MGTFSMLKNSSLEMQFQMKEKKRVANAMLKKLYSCSVKCNKQFVLYVKSLC